MIHDTKPFQSAAQARLAPSERSALATAHALRDVGIEGVNLSKKLFDNTHKMLFSAATNKDAKDVSRTMSAYIWSSYRDLGENAELVSRIWRRYLRAAAKSASA